MATFTDEELLFLCNLMHIKEEEDGEGIFDNIWEIDENSPTLKTVLEDYLTEERIEEFRNSDYVYDGEISGREWADMLQALKNDREEAQKRGEESILDLKIQDIYRDDVDALAACLTDSEGNAYVVFRGTSKGEWYDNFIGACYADTEQQRRALEYVESMDYDNITVVGHSKGGNKAKYTAILSDKVSRCVSFDGEGFSVEFFNKYSDLTEANAHKITNYALDGDFVNPLLTDINASEKKYIKGNGVDHFIQNHSPNSFFHFDKNGEYSFIVEEQNASMAAIHKFANYAVNVVEREKKEKFFVFLGTMVQMFLGKKPPEYEDKYGTEEQLEYVFGKENAEELGMLLAMMIKYEEETDGLMEAVEDICGYEVRGEITEWMRGKPCDKKKDAIFWMIALVLKLEETAGAEELFGSLALVVQGIVAVINKTEMNSEYAESINAAVNYARKYYNTLPEVRGNLGDYCVSKAVRDFRQVTLEELLKTYEWIDREPFFEVNTWKRYEGERWMKRVDMEGNVNNISSYFNETHNVNNLMQHRICAIFDEVRELDEVYAEKLREKNRELSVLVKSISEI